MTDTVFGIIIQAMNLLPTLALFAKITPNRIEATVFAFLTGTTNLASGVLSPLIGVWLNDKFFHVTADDLSNYKYLCLVCFFCTFLGFIIIPLIPLKEQIDTW
jgi:MFS family permease